MHDRSKARPANATPPSRARGFTLIELLITLAVLATVMVVVMSVVFMTQRSKTATANSLEANQAVRVALEMMARDLRSAGYGADRSFVGNPQPAIAYIDSLQVLMYADLAGGVGVRDTTAYDPTLMPQPFPLEGTAWRPTVKWRTGAEVVRWTLDINDDGSVNAGDIADSNGIDAMRTSNPNDYVLVRQIYGDSTASLAPGNGGVTERIALVRRPKDGVAPPMFTVWLEHEDEPWNWSSGPVPPARLQDIERIEIKVVGTSGRPNWRGEYSDSRLTSQVNSLRNTPNFGADEFILDGWVYVDANSDGNHDGTDPGVPKAIVRAGPFATSTDSTGYYLFRLHAGDYVVKHTPPVGYGSAASPDTYVVSLPPSATQSFVDSAKAGGDIYVHVYLDTDKNGTQDTGEPDRGGVSVQVDGTASAGVTDGNGNVRLWAPIGPYAATAALPDSFVATTPNPVTGSMTNFGSFSHQIGIAPGATAHVKGMVFKDNNRDGDHDTGEPGIADIWVGISPDGGATVRGFARTDGSGNYDITVPANDPPHTEAYYVYAIGPTQHFPTTPAALGPLWLSGGQVVNNKDFGFALYRIITLSASRVLSLGSGNLIEQDWAGGASSWASKGRGDADIVLGADAGGTDNISVWYNLYDDSRIFNTTPDKAYTAANSVLSLALASFDNEDPTPRLDVATGTARSVSGNLFVWKNQNSSGNLGILPATPTRSYMTADGGDVTSVLAMHCAGGSYADLIVGTKSPTAGYGTFEVWQNNEGISPTFTRDEVYPTAGGLPAGYLGEVTSMTVADFDVPPDGRKDLLVTAKVSATSGQVLFMRNVSDVTGARFVYAWGISYGGAFPTCVVASDVNSDSDNSMDFTVGLQTTTSSGVLHYWRNGGSGASYNFSLIRSVAVSGVPLTLLAADLGGAPNHQDIALGYRTNTSSFAGGIRVFFTDANTLPTSGVDPSGGELVNMVPALTANDFNYGVQPSTPTPPFLTDLAAGVKIDAVTGALVVFIR